MCCHEDHGAALGVALGVEIDGETIAFTLPREAVLRILWDLLGALEKSN